MFSFNIFAQNLDSVKHIIVVTELQDTMALINKDDINKINKTFYEKDLLDSLNTINDSIICGLQQNILKRDELLINYRAIQKADSIIKVKYQQEIKQQMSLVKTSQQEINKQKTQKYIWEGVSGGLALALLLVILL